MTVVTDLRRRTCWIGITSLQRVARVCLSDFQASNSGASPRDITLYKLDNVRLAGVEGGLGNANLLILEIIDYVGGP